MTGGIANGDINFLHDLVGAGGRVGEGGGHLVFYSFATLIPYTVTAHLACLHS